jgi:hypothetical protein
MDARFTQLFERCFTTSRSIMNVTDVVPLWKERNALGTRPWFLS